MKNVRLGEWIYLTLLVLAIACTAVQISRVVWDLLLIPVREVP